MDERQIFDRFHDALDVQLPPGAFSRFEARLAQATVKSARRPAIMLPWLRTGQRIGRHRQAWALAVIAAVLVVAFVAALVSVRGFHISAPTPAGHNVGKSDPWIVYQWVSPKSDYVTTLYLVRPDGSGLHALLPDSIWSRYSPDWSPDGQRIAFTANRGDRSDLWVVNADGSGARRIVSCDEPCNTVKSADWSPDGRRILFTQDDLPAGPGGVPTGFEFKVLDLASNAVTTIFSEHEDMPVEGARWSPDGHQIAFRRAHLSPYGDEIGAALFVRNLADGHERQLTAWDSFAADPDWGPDGRIVFNTLGGLGDKSNAANLYLIEPDGTGLRALTTYTAGIKVGATPRWTPDGSAILFTQEECWDGGPIAACLGDAGRWLRQLATIKPDATGLALATFTGVQGAHPELRPVH